MKWPSRLCHACAAKDAEIARLDERAKNAEGVANRLLQERDAALTRIAELNTTHAANLLQFARDAAGLTPPATTAPAPDPLPGLVEDFLIVRFGAGTAEYRRQLREARLLLAQGYEPLEVNERLKRGQEVEW